MISTSASSTNSDSIRPTTAHALAINVSPEAPTQDIVDHIHPKVNTHSVLLRYNGRYVTLYDNQCSTFAYMSSAIFAACAFNISGY